MNTAVQERPFESLAPLDPLIDKCVHCGFCLSTCPSYLLLGNEMDSPRGRIYMMKAGVENRAEMNVMTDVVVGHFDTCLGCMACMPACPSGVDYGRLIDHARAHIEETYKRPFTDRVLRWALANVLPSTIVASKSSGCASKRKTRSPARGCRAANWRACHLLKEKSAVSASAKKKLAPANTKTTTAANGPGSID